MQSANAKIGRRNFIKTVATASTVAAVAGPPSLAAGVIGDRKIKLGLDNFSVRALKWKADALIEYAASLKTDSLFITDLDAFENFEDNYLKGLRQKAADKDLQIHLGTWSICPTSKAFRNKWGTAEEHLALTIRMAKALGSPVARVILGTQEDRKTPGGIEARIEDTIKVLKSQRSRAIDAGVKVAVENHAGDMQARELKRLVESAGPESVGVCLDSGNPVWTIEDPHLTLDTLAPYVLTSHVRDSALWNTPQGAAVRWTRMGEGNMGMEEYLRTYIQKCPGRAVSLEVIVSGQPRLFNYRDPKFWENYRNTPAWEFARFLALCDNGKPNLEPAADPAVSPAARQVANVEASIKWTQEFLAKL